MKKIIYIILAFIGLAVIVASCKSETYADKLKKETEAINRFIDAHDIDVIYTYPKDHKFAANQYFKDPTGFYFRVINPGILEEKPSKTNPKTDVNLRYFNIINLLKNDTLEYTNNYGYSMDFTYGTPTTYSSTSYSTTYLMQKYMYLSQACVIPLDYGLGRNAEVSLIVPFEGGSTNQQSNYMPLYYGRLVYHFINPEETEE